MFWRFRPIVDNLQDSISDSNDDQRESYRRRRACRWLYKNIFITFRYGMVFLYVGTLLVVIGYHNRWINVARYIGVIIVILGLMLVVGASFCGFQRYIYGIQTDVDTVSRANSAGSKRSLPTYENAVNLGLPSYEEALFLKTTSLQNNCANGASAGMSSVGNSRQRDIAISLWPSIGHYSSRVSPSPDLRENDTAMGSRSNQTAISFHVDQVLPNLRLPGPENSPMLVGTNTSQRACPVGLVNPRPPLHITSRELNVPTPVRQRHFGRRRSLADGIILSPSVYDYTRYGNVLLPAATITNELHVPSKRRVSDPRSTSGHSSVGIYMSQSSAQPSILRDVQDEEAFGDKLHDDVPNYYYRTASLPALYNKFEPYNDVPARWTPHSPNEAARPRTSLTRPNTCATLLLESCSSSLYGDESFEQSLSSTLSDWKDDLPSIETIASPRRENSVSTANIETGSLEYNIGESNSNINEEDGMSQLLHVISTPTEPSTNMHIHCYQETDVPESKTISRSHNSVMLHSITLNPTREELSPISISEETGGNINLSVI